MDIRKIKKLIELLEESGVSEIEIREGEESVRIARNGPADGSAASGKAQVVATASAPVATSPSQRSASARAAEPPPPAPPTAAAGEHMVTAPMVGTFYSAPSPGAKQFVDIGDEVQVGQVLCTIEAMKMMNQIESDVAGKIRAVLVKNGDPVEFGQPLFIIE
jgi:acetyl-CoA carboxylase biotin carboxyl carrier protein